jgi:hypothetical protein
MCQDWQHRLPGFEWISWKSFVLGAIESYGYGTVKGNDTAGTSVFRDKAMKGER